MVISDSSGASGGNCRGKRKGREGGGANAPQAINRHTVRHHDRSFPSLIHITCRDRSLARQFRGDET